jgi:hypothetical protein
MAARAAIRNSTVRWGSNIRLRASILMSRSSLNRKWKLCSIKTGSHLSVEPRSLSLRMFGRAAFDNRFDCHVRS